MNNGVKRKCYICGEVIAYDLLRHIFCVHQKWEQLVLPEVADQLKSNAIETNSELQETSESPDLEQNAQASHFLASIGGHPIAKYNDEEDIERVFEPKVILNHEFSQPSSQKQEETEVAVHGANKVVHLQNKTDVENKVHTLQKENVSLVKDHRKSTVNDELSFPVFHSDMAPIHESKKTEAAKMCELVASNLAADGFFDDALIEEEQLVASNLATEGFFDDLLIEEDEVAEDTSIIGAKFDQPMDL